MQSLKGSNEIICGKRTTWDLEYRKFSIRDFGVELPCGSVYKNLPASAGDMSSIPAPGIFHMQRGNYAHEPQLLKLLYARAGGHSY